MEAAPDTVSENEPQPDWTTGLEGTWKSDWPLTKQHLEADCNLSAEATLGLERLLGKMTVQYDGHRAIYTMPEIRYIKAGEEYILAGWTREEAPACARSHVHSTGTVDKSRRTTRRQGLYQPAHLRKRRHLLALPGVFPPRRSACKRVLL